MKKIFAGLSAMTFMALFSLSVMSFTDDDPKKQKPDSASTPACHQHNDAKASADCCEKKQEDACCEPTAEADAKRTETTPAAK